MRLARARITPFRLALRRPLVTAHGEIRIREGLLLELESEDGGLGLGEAAPLPGFGVESRAECEEKLLRLVQALLGREVEPPLGAEPDAFEQFARALAPNAPCARAALDAALLDLVARATRCSVASLLAKQLGTSARDAVPVNALLTQVPSEALAEEARHAVAGGFRTLKLKLGADAPRDLERARCVRRAVGPEVALRLDANGGWREDEAHERLAALAEFAPELVEQPIPPGDVSALARLRAVSQVPLAADESVCDEPGAEALLEARAVDALVLKPSLLGLRAAARIAARARGAGVACVVTSLLDSVVGRTAALQLAAALSPPALAAGLATGPLLADDLGAEAPIASGALAVPAAGFGSALDRGALKRAASGRPRELVA